MRTRVIEWHNGTSRLRNQRMRRNALLRVSHIVELSVFLQLPALGGMFVTRGASGRRNMHGVAQRTSPWSAPVFRARTTRRESE